MSKNRDRNSDKDRARYIARESEGQTYRHTSVQTDRKAAIKKQRHTDIHTDIQA